MRLSGKRLAGNCLTGALEEAPINDLRMALSQNQPSGTPRIHAQIEAMTGQRRELRDRGRPQKLNDGESVGDPTQGKLPS
jgi:putative transposase